MLEGDDAQAVARLKTALRGYDESLGAVTLSTIAPGAEARLRVRYGADVLDPADLRSAQFVAERTFLGFPAVPRGAVDLTPR